MLRFATGGITLVLLIGVLLAAWLWFESINLKNLIPQSVSATSYSEAVKRFGAWQTKDAVGINPVCHSQLLSHGDKVVHVIILLHGYTNCPQQFRKLGETFYERGFNVLIPRMPHHGLADRMTTEQAKLTAEEMINYTSDLIDMAHGFGVHVTVFGFSAGGVMTAWAAQYRSDVDQAVIISPALGVSLVPSILTKPFVNLILAIPNFFRWWDPEKKLSAPGPQYPYPRFSSYGLAQIMRLGLAIQADASRLKPQAHSIWVITNVNDPSLNNPLISALVNHWRKQGAENLQTYEFNIDSLHEHDIIDPEQDYQQIKIIYPILVELTTRGFTK
ncbi:MAG: alpha/beta fold hydrolase [Caldilineaceae bacterium]